MYPYLRMFKELLVFRNSPRLDIYGTHESVHRIWPWDLDPWLELNNGRTLTIYDLGRIPLALRAGMHRVMSEKGWGLVVAGCSIRYRKRVTLFKKVTVKSTFIGWDKRFLYMHQSMWDKDECTSHVLMRAALVQASKGRSGIVAPTILTKELGWPDQSPLFPNWVQAWIDAEAERPWPPEH